jgi:hypothetical protein
LLSSYSFLFFFDSFILEFFSNSLLLISFILFSIHFGIKVVLFFKCSYGLFNLNILSIHCSLFLLLYIYHIFNNLTFRFNLVLGTFYLRWKDRILVKFNIKKFWFFCLLNNNWLLANLFNIFFLRLTLFRNFDMIFVSIWVILNFFLNTFSLNYLIFISRLLGGNLLLW